MKFGSLFSGIGGFDLGFQRAGLSCAWQAEIDSDCNRVLEKHWNGVTKYKDVSTIGRLEPVGVICGGFPCQDLSVAGKRKGLAGERSGLWFEFLRIIGLNRPRWVVIENVPGLLSSDEGRDFAVILRGLVECGYCLAWRVLDAQYDRVAQRRRRVFIVGSLGDGSCAEILFESESVSWNPPTRREAREGVTPILEIGARTNSNGRRDGDGIGVEGDPMFTLQSGKQHGVAATLDQRGRGPTDAVMMNLQVTHALRSEGADASEDGTGRGTPLVVFDERNITSKENRSNPQPGDPCHTLHADPPTLIAFSSKDHGADAGGIAPTLRSQNFKDSHINGGGQVAIAFDIYNQSVSEVVGTLRDPNGTFGDALPAIAFTERGREGGANLETQEELSYALRDPQKGMNSRNAIAGRFGVRRLTPRECERLQGFPDVKREIILEVCLDHLKNLAAAGGQNHKSQRRVGNAAKIKPQESAKSADRHSPQSNQSNSERVPLSVLINCGENEIEICSQGKSLSYANIAGRQNGYPLPMPVENFVHLIAGICSIAEKTIQTGAEASHQNAHHSIQLENGKPLVRLFGREITQLVSDAITGSITSGKPTKSITLNPLPLSPLEQRLATSFCSVWSAMTGCIPELTAGAYSCLRLQLNTSFGWTAYDANGKEISDSARYRLLGNAVCVNLAEWIGTRILKHAR